MMFPLLNAGSGYHFKLTLSQYIFYQMFRSEKYCAVSNGNFYRKDIYFRVH